MSSAATAGGQRDFASFPAVGAIVEAIGAKTNFVLAFADGAILFADALAFRFVARGAENGTGHDGLPLKTVPEQYGARQGNERAKVRGQKPTFASANELRLLLAL